MRNHTQKELTRLSPETMLFKHTDKIHLPEFIIQEIWEQKNFYSQARLIEMSKWSYDRFIDWYNLSD